MRHGRGKREEGKWTGLDLTIVLTSINEWISFFPFLLSLVKGVFLFGALRGIGERDKKREGVISFFFLWVGSGKKY